MTAPLIGLVGRKRSGKDTVARRLVEAHAFTRFAFADLLREAALTLNPIVLPMDTAWASYRLAEVVRADGWEAAKDLPEVRRTLQNYGMAIREIDPDFWVRPVLGALAAHAGPAVIADVRFPNEAEAIRAAGGTLVRIIRPGLDESDAHISETALANYPVARVLVNNSTIEHMYEKVDAVIADKA